MSSDDTKNSLSGKTTPERASRRPDDLISETPVDDSGEQFEDQLEKTLKETELAVLKLTSSGADLDQARTWQRARELVEDFKPVPWFIWRLANYVLGKPGSISDIQQGMVFGLRRLMFASASDPVLGMGAKVNNVRQALEVVPPDVVAAVSVIHAVCRRLSKRPHERIWRPLLDDALLRSRIGVHVGTYQADFGPGRGMLAGFAGRSGLATLIACGELDEARRALELLATGAEIKDVGLAVYQCDPLQVSAMSLSGSGCGRDAAFGTVCYASDDPLGLVQNDEQMRWLAAFTITEKIRRNSSDTVPAEFWEALALDDEGKREHIISDAKKVIRRGHGWGWIV